jgi:hypothetical protein
MESLEFNCVECGTQITPPLDVDCALSWQYATSLQENGCKTYKRLTLKCPNQQKVLGTMGFCQFIVVQIFLSIFLSIFVNVFVNFVNLSICQFFVNFCEFF